LNVRGMFSLLPDEPERSENIEAMAIVDKYLEHSRIMVFCNGGAPKYFLSSADWMPRNLDGRVEVGFPIYDTSLQAELRAFLDLQWKDNVKARILDQNLENRYRQTSSSEKVRAQVAFYDVLQEKHPPKKGTPEGSHPAKREGTTDKRPVTLPFDPKKRLGQPSV